MSQVDRTRTQISISRIAAVTLERIAHSLQRFAYGPPREPGDWSSRAASLGVLLASSRGVIGALVLVTIAAAAIASGLLRFPANPQDRAKDAALVTSSILHALYGATALIAAWLAGAGLLCVLARRSKLALTDLVLGGYLVGLIAACLLCVISIVVPGGTIVAGLAWLFCVGGLLLAGYDKRDLDGLVKAIGSCVTIAALFGAWCGIFRHGPTATLTAWPHPDAGLYAGLIASWTYGALPLRNLGFEGDSFSYFNAAWPLFGACLGRWIEIDPYLFVVSGGASAFMLGSGVAVWAYVYGLRRLAVALSSAPLLTVLGACLVSSLYPSWVVDSVPMIHMVPLTIVIWHFMRRSIESPKWVVIGGVAGLAGTLVAKVASTGLLVPIAVLPLAVAATRLSRGLLGALFAAVVAFAVFCAVMMYRYLPLLLSLGYELAPLSWIWYKLGFEGLVPLLMRDLGGVVLVLSCLLIRPWPLALILGVNLLFAVFMQVAFFVNLPIATLILALIVLDGRATGRRFLIAVGLAIGLSLPQAVFRDPAGWLSGVVWLVHLGGLLLAIMLRAVAVSDGRGDATPLRRAAPRANGIVSGAVAASAIGLFAVANGTIPARSGYWYPTEAMPGLTPELRQIWQAVRTLTPKDALVFTDQVSRQPELTGGWNTYTMQGGRQIYFGQYVQVVGPNSAAGILDERHRINLDVVGGRRPPSSAPTSRPYGSRYCVVARQSLLARSRMVRAENERYALVDCND